jgi:hypothetical protein
MQNSFLTSCFRANENDLWTLGQIKAKLEWLSNSFLAVEFEIFTFIWFLIKTQQRQSLGV